MRTSRLTARVDNNAIADGFQIYLHSFIVTAAGEWAVVQQGMNEAQRPGAPLSLALRLGPRLHVGAAHRDRRRAPGRDHEPGRRARPSPAQDALLAIARERSGARRSPKRAVWRCRAHHDVRAEDVDLKRLGAVLAVAYERELRDFASLLLLENLGPRTLQSLALIAEVVHGAPTPLRRSGALLVRARRQGRPPVPGAAQDLRRIDRHSEEFAR